MKIGDIVYVKLELKAIMEEKYRTLLTFKVINEELVAFNTVTVNAKDDLFIPAEMMLDVDKFKHQD